LTATVGRQLRQHIAYLASDRLRGRGVAEDTMVLARDYVRDQMAEAGLRLDLAGGTPFQRLEIPTGNKVRSIETNFAKFSAPGGVFQARVDDGFGPLVVGKKRGTADGKIIFAGYGISAPELSYDDYKGIDATDAVVIVLRKEPGPSDPDSPFDGVENTRHAYFQTKIANAISKGAKAVLIVNDPDSTQVAIASEQLRIDQEQARIQELERSLEKLPQAATRNRQSIFEKINQAKRMIQSLTAGRDTAARGVLGLDDAGEGSAQTRGVIVGSIARDIADRLLQSEGTSLTTVEAAINSDFQPQSVVFGEATAQVSVDLTDAVAKTDNVIGYLPGKGPLQSEYIVIGAHYDHVGMGGYGSLAPGTIAVHNGADDNASGTSAMLCSAEFLRKRLENVASHRSILFIAFTGEERGLLGSQHYVENPLKPIERTAAMINLDMVGRLRDNELTVYGTGSAAGIESIVDKANRRFGFDLYKVATGYGPSDHQSFYRAGVPVLFFFTGLHDDYHRPSDDFDKIEYESLMNITELVSDVALTLATKPERLVYAETNRNVQIRRQMTAFLGVRVSQQSQGVLVTEVTAGGPAEKAGLQVGDVINRIGQQAVRSTQDVLSWVRQHSSGDEFVISVVRKQRLLSIRGNLERRR
ncbi:MAG: M28 family peptidase, partial [Planctomycetota bacterium]